MGPIRQQPILVGIETDPTLYHSEQACRPALPDSSQVSQVLAHTPTDLAALLPFNKHSTGELGAVAVTVVNSPGQINLYPLQADGINDLHRYIGEHDLGRDIAYPGHIRYDEVSCQLIAEILPS